MSTAQIHTSSSTGAVPNRTGEPGDARGRRWSPKSGSRPSPRARRTRAERGAAIPGEVGAGHITGLSAPGQGGITVIHATLDPASDRAGYARLRTHGPTAVAIGKFDGIHRGHRALLAHTVADARRQGLQAGAVTFDVHPAEVLRGQRRQYLTTLEERVELFARAGLDFVLVLRGSAELFAMAPQEFAERLITALGCRAIVVGANFRFGRGGAGDITTLRAVGTAHGTSATPLDLLPALGEPVSSSRIRNEVRIGDVERAAELLGRPLTIVGTLTDRDHERCAVAIPPNVVRPPAGRYQGWLAPVGASRHGRAGRVIVQASTDQLTVVVPETAESELHRGDQVRVGFVRAA